MLHFSRSYYRALLYLQLHLSFPSTPTLAKKKAFRTLLTQWILPHFRMLKYRGPVNLTFVKELFWKEPFFRVSYTKILIFGREKLSGYKYINYLAINILLRTVTIFHVFFLRPTLLEVIRNDSYNRGISQNAKGHRTPNELTLKFSD